LKKSKPLFTESTDVPVGRTIGEITALLIEAGAKSINTNYDLGRIISLSFVLPIGRREVPYSMPIRVDPVEKIFTARRIKHRQYPAGWKQRDRDQAERVAWRQLFWWLKANLALVELGMVKPDEVLWSYMLDREGRTFYEVHGPKLLEAPRTEGAS
jgi:hypothetical protein